MTSEKPLLSDEDEKFLTSITKQDQPPPLPVVPDHQGDAQIALLNGAQNVALPPETPTELTEEPEESKQLTPEASVSKKKTWSWLRRDSRDTGKNDQKENTAAGLHDIAEELRARNEADESPEDAQAKKEEEEMTVVLDKLNLAAVDNRVFSISEETKELLQQFTQVLKDLTNGVPTAYHDLESLLTNGDKQLQKTYNSLPSFLQKLVERLPEAMTKGLAPQIMAAAAERASAYGLNLEASGQAAGKAAKFMKTPSLKDLVGKPTAITQMLRNIFEFLKVRFPAFAGVNVLWSLALFLLLIVFWYAHKRGKEVRLEKERELTEKEMQELEKDWKERHPEDSNVVQPTTSSTTTTASPGATMEQVKAGIIEADAEKIAAASQAAQAREPVAQPVVP
ncbi:hypothetical protein LTS08_000911 [Lithohypha guttulata]|uniref:Uncharacterized protein n=1 Tax=Lithohypha guttulata TaxID=1690604 RepID=A0AAN7T4R2_9EURO|nr:hypothetical protein LTR51_006473 [Lithohypha guttulata]KAK5088682.1 hypothetical protein LTR05_002902 [Lithohypha guttulata]KAK5106788.1 hypothetical protein LTS08_000911 [Lithohypha guttulata]